MSYVADAKTNKEVKDIEKVALMIKSELRKRNLPSNEEDKKLNERIKELIIEYSNIGAEKFNEKYEKVFKEDNEIHKEKKR